MYFGEENSSLIYPKTGDNTESLPMICNAEETLLSLLYGKDAGADE